MKTALTVFALLTMAGPLYAQAGQWDCRVDSLSGYNCAGYYSGTVTIASELRGANVRQTLRVVATVTGGRVSCQVTGTETGNFTAPGMLAVTHAAGRSVGGGYDINVWCPTTEGERPHRGSAPLITVMRQTAADYAALEGRDEHEHPDTDSANNMTGTETITWSLRRR